MSPTALVTTLYLRALLGLQGLHARQQEDRERGDIPAWVLITIMTAGLITVVGAVAKTQLTSILQDALNSVKSPAS